MRRCLVLVLLLAACPLAFAQAYKWKDAQGVTHYSDSPPPTASGKVEKIQMKGGVNSATPATGPAPAASAASKPAAAPGTPVADNPANRAKLCDQLHKNMDVLQKEAIVSVDDGKGGQQQLDAAGRQRQQETTQAQMTLYCKQ